VQRLDDVFARDHEASVETTFYRTPAS
jgi:hypothetical protein